MPPRFLRRGTAPIGRCGSYWSGSRRPSRSCSCSTTSTGLIRHRSSCWVRSFVGHRMRPCSSRWRFVPVRRRTGCRTHLSGRTASGLFTASHLGPLTREQARDSPRRGRRRCRDWRALSTRAVAIRSTSNSWRARSVESPQATRAAYSSMAGLDVPAAVAGALAEEFALLSDEARLVLQGAAVAGDPFEPELAAAAAATSEALALEALDALLRLDLIRQTDVPRRFRFRHPSFDEQSMKSTPAGWRLGAHERCAAALERQGAPGGRTRPPCGACRAAGRLSCGRGSPRGRRDQPRSGRPRARPSGSVTR